MGGFLSSFMSAVEVLNVKMKGWFVVVVRSTVLYKSETWCLREIEMAIIRRTERAL